MDSSCSVVSPYGCGYVCSNSKKVPVNMIVADALPTSSDARIKVVPVEPSKEQLEDGTAEEQKVQVGAFEDTAVGETARTTGDKVCHCTQAL